jgi:uncharacterized protein
VHIVGHELGGRLGFNLSLRQPEPVRALLALNALHSYWSVRRLAPHAWRQWWNAFAETPFVGRTVLRQLPAFARVLVRMGQPDTEIRSASAVEEFVAPLREPARACAAERVQTCFAYREIVPTLLGMYRFPRLRVPTLMLNGTKDFALSKRAERLRADSRRSADRARRGRGHFLAEQHPRLVTDRVACFFSRPCGDRSCATRAHEMSGSGEPTGPTTRQPAGVTVTHRPKGGRMTAPEADESVRVVLETFRAIENRDVQRLLELYHPELEFHWPPSLPYGGSFRANGAAAQGWSETWVPLQPTETEWRMDPRVIAATEAEVVVLWRQRGVAPSGERFDGEVLGLYEIRDGKLARAQMFYFDSAAVSRFLDQARAHEEATPTQ